MVRADAFDETFGAVRQLSGRNLDLTVNCVVTNTNLGHLRNLVDLLLPFSDLTLKFSMTQPKGGASVDHAFRALVPDIEACGRAIHDAITYGIERVSTEGRGPRFAHDGVPFCLLPDYERLYDDLRTHDFAAMTETFEPDFFPVDNGATIQPDETCRACALRGPCPGLFTAYAEMRGTSALRTAPPGVRSNSWTYTPERIIPKSNGGCPVYASPIPWDLGRTLFVDEGDRYTVYRTESRDFHDSETRRYKRDLGQVYLDISNKPAPDDFATDLRKLRLAPTCARCDKQGDCANAFVPVEEDVFTVADRRVREAIAALIARMPEGSLAVDVGCSDDGRYADLWEPAVRAGRVRYLGIEPDRDRAARLRERFPWAEVRAIPVEEAGSIGDSLGAVLVLRSWNHLRRPAEALGPLALALAPGGTLLVADNVAFGLCRSDAQRHRAETSTAAWEHYRNDESADAIAALAGLPLAVVSEVPVVPEGANQWIVELRRESRRT